MSYEKKPLYRKENSKARGCNHMTGPDAKHQRGTKLGIQKNMKQGKQRGLDYTPLFRFLLSKVGQDWTAVYKEAKSRVLDESEIFYMVQDEKPIRPYVRFERELTVSTYFTYGESTHFSRLFVDENNILQKVDPNLKNEDFAPSCPCCTFTFNGKPLTKKFNWARRFNKTN